MNYLATDSIVLIHEAEPEMRAVYARHIESSRVPVMSVGTHEQFLEAVGAHKPTVALFSSQDNGDRLWQTMIAATNAHPSLHIVLLTTANVVTATETLGTNIAAHLSKQQSSPKEVVRVVINLLNQSYSHV